MSGLYNGVSGLWSGASGLMVGGDGSGLVPALSLDFTTGTLDSRITFSRASLATVVDSTGKVTYAPHNLLLRSQEFDNASWSKSLATVTANAAVAPDGTTTADRFGDNGAGGTSTPACLQTVTVPTSSRLIFSFYGKADQLNWVRVRLGLFTTPSGFPGVYFDLGTGAVGTVDAGLTASIASVGDGWYRCTVAFTTDASDTSGEIAFRLAEANNDELVDLDGTSSVYIWGAQLEAVTYQTTPGAYIPTTTAAVHGPRFDHDPVTLEPLGLLIEEQRTNLCLRSQEFDNAYWASKTNVTVTANAVAAPDGTTTADTIVETAAANRHLVDNFAGGTTVTNAQVYTLSAYFKAAGRDFAHLILVTGSERYGVIYDIANGSVTNTSTSGSPTGTASGIQALGNGWYRCWLSMHATATTAYSGFGPSNSGTPSYSSSSPTYAGNASLGVHVWGAQLEAGAFATSYIPTVASTVTRSADNATMTGTNFSSWYNQSEGAFVVEGDSALTGTSTLANFFSVHDGSANEAIICRAGNFEHLFVLDGGAFQCQIDAGTTPTAGTNVKISSAYKLNDFAACIDGGSVVTDLSGTLPTVTRINMGASVFGNSQLLNGHIKSLSYYNTRLPDETLQELTA